MRLLVRRLSWLLALEALAVASLILAPGAGHSPVLYTQLPALLVAGRLAPSAGACIQCAPSAWATGIALQTALLAAIVAAVTLPRLRAARPR